MSQTLPDPSTTLVILLGAHEWSDNPDWSSLAFKNSHRLIKDYLLDLGIPEDNFKDLFDSNLNTTATLEEIHKFLNSKIANTKDLLIYYIGHGYFTSNGSKYHIAIHSTSERSKNYSGLEIANLASLLKEEAATVRKYVILDSCFADAALKFLQTDLQGLVEQKTEEAFEGVKVSQHELAIPCRGTVLLSSSRHTEVSRRTDESTGFTEAFVKVVRKGHPLLPKYLTVEQTTELIRSELSQSNTNRSETQKFPLPIWNCPDQPEGNLGTKIPFFPNPSYVEPDESSFQVSLNLPHDIAVKEYLSKLIVYFDEIEENDIIHLSIKVGKQLKPQQWRYFEPKLQLDGEPIEVESALVKYKEKGFVALLGEPGAGKSTTLRRLFRQFARSFLPNIDLNYDTGQPVPDELLGRIPIFADLQEWKDGTFEQFSKDQVAKHSKMLAEALPNLLEDGEKIILLLDAVNQIPALKRDENQQIKDERLMALNSLHIQGLRGVVTCRVEEAKGLTWLQLHVQPLTKDQITEFSKLAFEFLLKPELAESFITELMPDGKWLSDADPIWEFIGWGRVQSLAQQPFFLWKLVNFYFNNKGQALSENPAIILQATLQDILKNASDKGKILYPELADRLALLAFNMTDMNTTNTDQKQAIIWLNKLRPRMYEYPEPDPPQAAQEGAKEWLQAGFDLRLLVNTGSGVRFIHQLWQEYFAAVYWLANALEILDVAVRWQRYEHPQLWILIDGLKGDILGQAVINLTDPQASRKAASAAIIGLYFDEIEAKSQTIELLIGNLTDFDAEVVRYAIKALGNLRGVVGTEHAVDPLIARLEDSDELLRSQAAKALGNFKSVSGIERSIIPLIESLEDNFAVVRRMVAHTLGNLVRVKGIEQAIDPLIIGLKDIDWSVRAEATWALGQFAKAKVLGVERALHPLIEMLDDEHEKVREAAIWPCHYLRERMTSTEFEETK